MICFFFTSLHKFSSLKEKWSIAVYSNQAHYIFSLATTSPIQKQSISGFYTGRWNPRDKRATRMNHSYVDFQQSSWNLVCGILCLKPNTKRNFSSFGPVVFELWLILIEILAIWGLGRRREKKCVFQHIFGHIGHEIFVRAGFCHRGLHT